MPSLPWKIMHSQVNYFKAIKINSKVFHPSKLLNFTVWESCLPLLEGERKHWKERTKIRDDNIIIFFFWASFEIQGRTRGFYTTQREPQLFACTLSGTTIFVSPSHTSCAGISQGSFHGMHCSQLDATNCPTTILRNSLFGFSNLENKGTLQAALTGKSYIFSTK